MLNAKISLAAGLAESRFIFVPFSEFLSPFGCGPLVGLRRIFLRYFNCAVAGHGLNVFDADASVREFFGRIVPPTVDHQAHRPR